MFQAEQFQARSGRTVKFREDGSLFLDHANGYIAPEVVSDVEEWAQAKHDADLLRWRWPENPDFVVYRRAEAGVLVVDERDGNSWYYRPKDVNRVGRPYDAACAYWAAHPEPKPWEDAKPGEVWELTIDDGSVHTVFVHEDRTMGGRNGVSAGGAYFDIDDADHVTAGRRVWPEAGE